MQTRAAFLAWLYAQGITECWDTSPSHTLVQEGTLEDLYKDIRNFEGCALKKGAMHTVIADGDPKSPLMVIGEAPGADEDRLGKPFVGISGQLLMLMLQAIGLQREDVYITNIIPWRPPSNRPPSPEEIEQCLPFVERHISLIKPKIVLLVGGVACKALMRTQKGVSMLQEGVLSYHSEYLTEPLPAIAVYHPSYLLRSPGQKRTAWKQLLKLKTLMAAVMPTP